MKCTASRKADGAPVFYKRSKFRIVSKSDIILDVSKHQRTLEAVFEKRANIPWPEIESMLKSLGAEISEGRGSRVRIALRGVRAVFHRPHPQKETDRGAVASMRRFLTEAGIEPGEFRP
jgi:hypothetical protein